MIKLKLSNLFIYSLACFFAFILLSNLLLSHDIKPIYNHEADFNNFVGSVYSLPSGLNEKLGVGWIRNDFLWTQIEPKLGQWNWKTTDTLVQKIHAQGSEVLPMLGYTAEWASSSKGNDKAPPKSTSTWKLYVERVVSRYSQPPFNLRYFQVWNEPTREAGFWLGASNVDFIDSIYIPAAEIIRSHGCYVVFGGWPLSNSLEALDGTLKYKDAWKLTDIVDTHYLSNSAWQYLHKKWIENGKILGIWQTEVGFRSTKNFLPDKFLRAFYWSLSKGWTFKEQYKLFWFPSWGNGSDSDKSLTTTDSTQKNILTSNGKSLAFLNTLLKKGSISIFSDFSVQPSLPFILQENASTSVGFNVKNDNTLVIALLLKREFILKNSSLNINTYLKNKPKQISLVNAYGQEIPSKVSMYRDNRLFVEFSSVELQLNTDNSNGDDSTFIAYLQIHQ